VGVLAFVKLHAFQISDIGYRGCGVQEAPEGKLPRMTSHKFKIGQTVRIRAVHNRVQGGPCEITRLMPLQGDEPEYQIKRIGEPYQRVAGESELSAT
jgi:hypothetical protein